MPARPPAPFKPLRMIVSHHYYIKTKSRKNYYPTQLPQKKKCVTSKNLTRKDKNERRETALTFDRAALTSADH
jgi:hypothetical protein